MSNVMKDDKIKPTAEIAFSDSAHIRIYIYVCDKRKMKHTKRGTWNRICRKYSDFVCMKKTQKLTLLQWKIPIHDVNAISTKINNRIYWTIYKYNRFRSVVEWNICACGPHCLFSRSHSPTVPFSSFSRFISLLLLLSLSHHPCQTLHANGSNQYRQRDYNTLHRCEHSFFFVLVHLFP